MMALAAKGLALLSNFKRDIFFLTLDDMIISERTPLVIDLEKHGSSNADDLASPAADQSANNCEE